MLTTVAVLFAIHTAAAHPTACQVLTPRDIGRVQHAKLVNTKLTETSTSGIDVSQCFYQMPHFTDSITVDLIRGKAREFWEKHFGDVRTVSDEVEERESQSTSVSGVGEKAVWSGNRMAGALYILNGDTIVRISVGGAGSTEQKIEKAKKLGAKVIRKL
jgi:hypothetical protein